LRGQAMARFGVCRTEARKNSFQRAQSGHQGAHVSGLPGWGRQEESTDPIEPLAVSVVPGGVNPLWGIYDDMGVFQTMS